MHSPILIAPNLYKLPAHKPACHCYLITGKKNTLIDTGVREYKQHLYTQLQYLNLNFRDIHDVIYTHCHYDHTGGGELFPRSTVYSHYLCRNKLFYKDDQSIHALKYQAKLPLRIPDQTWTHGDHYINGDYKFEIIHTPGHTDDSICLLETKTKILISGDTVFAKGIPSLITDSGSDGSLLYSIETLMKYNISLILPGHGYIEENPLNALEESRKNIIKRISQKNQKIMQEAIKCHSIRY